MAENRAGFEEIAHTADWALKVWAPDLPQLFAQAAQGMVSLLAVEIDPARRVEHRLALECEDAEGLLVAFLAELLYLMESERLAFDTFDLAVEGLHLSARLSGAALLSQGKEIKAVTYHNLKIQSTPAGYTVTIVFDV